MNIHTTREIIEKAFVKDRIFWHEHKDYVDRIFFMDNEPKNNKEWVSIEDYKRLLRFNNKLLFKKEVGFGLTLADIKKYSYPLSKKEEELLEYVLKHKKKRKEVRS